MKHICLFSGGAGSAYMSYLVAKKYPNDTILLNHSTKAEHYTTDIFKEKVSNLIGLPITDASDGRSLWEVIDDNHCLPSQFMPFCTRILKHEPAEKFYKNVNDDFCLYIGYGPEEWRRIQKQTARFEHSGRSVKYPIAENNILNNEVKRIIKEDWKICLPEPYKYLKHNNCLPCFKGGEAHFYKVWKYYPEYFQKAVEKEKQIGHTVFKKHPLPKLVEIWSKQKDLFTEDELNESIPCLCSL